MAQHQSNYATGSEGGGNHSRRLHLLPFFNARPQRFPVGTSPCSTSRSFQLQNSRVCLTSQATNGAHGSSKGDLLFPTAAWVGHPKISSACQVSTPRSFHSRPLRFQQSSVKFYRRRAQLLPIRGQLQSIRPQPDCPARKIAEPCGPWLTTTTPSSHPSHTIRGRNFPLYII